MREGRQSEKLIERRLREEVKKRGGLCIKLLAGSHVGLPDRLVLLPEGRVLFVETKSTGDKPRKVQVYMHRKLRALGFGVFVVDRVEQINEILDL